MYPDRLYDLALNYRKTKLWKVLYDSEFFAVSLSNGQIGYCCVMGFLGEHIALALYIGNRGLDSYRLLQNMGRVEMNALKEQEWMVSQDCLQCAFECKESLSPRELTGLQRYAKPRRIMFRGANAFPQFVKYSPACYPWPVAEPAEIGFLCEALMAALEVSAKLAARGKDHLGFTEGPAYDREIPLLTPIDDGFAWTRHRLPPEQSVCYPEPKLRDELLLRRLKQVKKRSGTWICDVVMVPQPVTEFEGDADEANVESAPRFPYMLLAADQKTQTVFPVKMVSSYADGAEEMLTALGSHMLEDGIPRQIQVVDQRTLALLKNPAETLGIKLVQQREDALLDDLEEEFFAYCNGPRPNIEEEIQQMVETLLLADENMLLSMPDELLQQLRLMERQGLLPEEIADKIRSI